ncbi:MAG: hypothetical protein JJE17_07045 [Peptostreptococcaceae bacterium]|nr:hypothetical protein [Peptostreptococcaceae bacterium]
MAQLGEETKEKEIYYTYSARDLNGQQPGEIAFLANDPGETEIELVYMPQVQKFE